MTDLPDWTSPVQQSGSAYRGALAVVMDGSGSKAANLDFDLNTLDRSILVFTPVLPIGVEAQVTIQVPGAPPIVTRATNYIIGSQMVVGYASREIAATWRVRVQVIGPGADTYTWYVFTDQLLPMVDLAWELDAVPLGDGVQDVEAPSLASLPYVFSEDSDAWFRMREADDNATDHIGILATAPMLRQAAGGMSKQAAAGALGDSETGDRLPPAAEMIWTPHSGGTNLNAARWRRRQGRTLTVPLPSAARTTSQFVISELWDGLGVIIIIDVTAQAGGSITLDVYSRAQVAPNSAAQPPVLSSVPIVAVGTYSFRIHPGITPVANRAVADLLTEIFLIGVTANNANSITYSLEVHTVN